MNIIICLDDKNGISFNGRRQSRDRLLYSRVAEYTRGAVLWMNQSTAALFGEYPVRVAENFLNVAGKGEYCFAENGEFLNNTDSIEKVIIYRWNRVYPRDEIIDLAFLSGKSLVSAFEFKGSSHEKITEEVYE